MRKRYERELLIGAVFLLVVVGGGLIGLFFGIAAMLTALPCLLGGAGVIAGLYLFFAVLERWSED
jgi:hypothetical protein